MSLIKCNNLTLGYEGKKVIKNLNIEINSGDYLCIIGENGSGKSTLVKALLNLIKPMKGKIKLDLSLKQAEIGYLPQMNTNQKDFPASVFEVVISGLLNKRGWLPFYTKQNKEKVEENLKKLKIQHLKKKCFKELSGGEQQRVLLARALCATSKVLLLDEPVTGLDPKTTSEFYKLVEKLNKEDKITIIMVSHDIKASVEYATHILSLEKDDYFYGSKNEYLKKEGK